MDTVANSTLPHQESGLSVDLHSLAESQPKNDSHGAPQEGRGADHHMTYRRYAPRRLRGGGCVPLHVSDPRPAAPHDGHVHEPEGSNGQSSGESSHVQRLAAATGIAVDRIGALQSHGKSVGRIEVSYGGGEGFQLAGTAWLVRSDVAVTSRHVAMHSQSGFAGGIGRNPPLRTNIYGEEPVVEIDFGEERCTVKALEWVENLDEELASPDLAVLRLEKKAKAAPLKLTTLRENQSVAVIQYPVVPGPENGNRVLRQPGEVHLSGGQVVAFDARLRILAHTAITHGGSSGSPVIDLETLRVVGIHSGSKFGFLNCATLASVIGERLELLGIPPESSRSSLLADLAPLDEADEDDDQHDDDH